MFTNIKTSVITLLVVLTIGILYLLFGIIVFDLIFLTVLYGFIIREKIKYDAEKKK